MAKEALFVNTLLLVYYNGAVMAGEFWSKLQRMLPAYQFGNGNRITRYVLPLILVCIIFLVKFTFFALIQQDVPFLLSSLVVLISAYYGGLGPGILATILTGVFTDFFFLSPKGHLFSEQIHGEVLILGIFFLEGISISLLSEARRKYLQQRSEFMGVVSHELKNPLSSIKGYAQMIERQADDKQIRDFAARINRQIGFVTDMVNELLDITKIETGRLTYHMEEFAVNDVLREVVFDQQVTTKHKIVCTGNSKAVMVGDPYRIRQVISNVVANAVKYSPKAKKVNVTIKDGRGTVTITVRDYGVGIPRKDLPKVFNPFYRAGNSRYSSMRGTGIGLFISSQIVAKHKGSLWVKSVLNKGSTFFLKLPTVKQ